MSEAWKRGLLRAVAFPREPRTVVKFGGSLLLRPTWPAELRGIVANCTGPTTVVVGGGPVVDGLRTIDAAGSADNAAMHRLAIDALAITARLAAEMTGLRLASAPADAGGGVILDTPAWLVESGRLASLPAGWHVTSDSIAATVAVAAAAGLLLVKSVPPPPVAGDLATLADHGWVDDHFPVAAATLGRIEWAAPAMLSPRSSR